ncbi:hypothetical protein KEM56_004720 [Ascosphaera pollenicola]|nr:hypothetical protein KEM56_004720 [Ascosphaera pollenicola]
MVIFQRLDFIPHLNLPPLVSVVVGFVVSFIPLMLILYYHESKRSAEALNPRGCRRLGMPTGLSNLSDQYSYGTEGVRMGETPPASKIRIKALMTYPIKSCRGVELPTAKVESTGILYDRTFCFAEYAEESEGRNGEKEPAHWAARTMRDAKFRRMTLIIPEIWLPDPSSPSYSTRSPNVLSQGVLVVRFPREIAPGSGIKGHLLSIAMKLGLAPSEERFQVPLNPPPGHDYPSHKLKVWSDYPLAFDYGKHVPQSLARFLGATKSLSLLRIDPEHFRKMGRCAPSKDELGFAAETALADVYPLDLQNISSVREVGKRVQNAIPKLSVIRYRPNIVIEGVPAYNEDDWKKIKVIPRKLRINRHHTSPEPEKPAKTADTDAEDEATLIHVVSRTPRCRLPNVDPDTGMRHPVEPDKTMRSFRRIDAGFSAKACLGMQLVPAVKGDFHPYERP